VAAYPAVTRHTPDLLEFVAEWLAAPPAGLLESGCGAGELTRHPRRPATRPTASTPRPPEGPPFERRTLED
jgi:hypothetical protein